MAEENFYDGMDVSVTDISSIPSGIADKLAELGLKDAAQFVDALRIPGVAETMSNYLDISVSELIELTAEVRRNLPPEYEERRQELEPLAFGVVLPPEREPDEPSILPLQTPPAAAALPTSVNNGAVLGQPRSQGARGTCVAFAVTAVHEHARISKGAGTDLSEQFLYDETKKIDGMPNTCGTWQMKAALVVRSLGQCREAVWPYNRSLPCNNNGVQPANAKPDAAARTHTLFKLVPTSLSAIKTALANGKVVGFSIPVFDSWVDNPTSRRFGRITMPTQGEQSTSAHAMCLIGYKDQSDVPGGGYFILRNSWFGSWGTQSAYGSGNGVIPYAYITKYNMEALTY
jgi:Papain family cysteine protease